MQKIGLFGVVRGLRSLKVIGNITPRQSTYDFVFDFNRNNTSIVYHFRVMASYLSKVADFNVPNLHLASPFGVTPFEFLRDLWRQKTRVPALSCGVVCMILCLAVLIKYRRVMDGQTNIQTDARRQQIGLPRQNSVARQKSLKVNVTLPISGAPW